MKDEKELKSLLDQVAAGSVSPEEAALQLREVSYDDLGYAKTDLHRAMRQGIAEVIYGAGKTPEQITGIVEVMRRNGQDTILITRLSAEAAEAVGAAAPGKSL